MSNPEFKRNLWLSFSMHRLIGMPALLALTFITIAFADFRNEVASSLYTTSICCSSSSSGCGARAMPTPPSSTNCATRPGISSA